MKSLLSLFVIGLNWTAIQAQTCLPIDNVTWVNLDYCHGEPPGVGTPIQNYDYFTTALEDTIIQGQTYRLLYRDYHKTQLAGGLRCDSTRAYVVPSGESNEYVLYDFGSNVGDTLRDILVFDINSGYELLDFVHDATVPYFQDSVMELYPVKDTLWWGNKQTWREGLGGLGSFGTLSASSNINCNTSLACVAINDTSIYPVSGEYQCGYPNIGLQEGVQSSFPLSPNPTSSTLFIPEGLQSADVHVYSTTGELILNKKAGAELNVQHLPEGLYVVQFRSNSELVHTEKILVQH